VQTSPGGAGKPTDTGPGAEIQRGIRKLPGGKCVYTKDWTSDEKYPISFAHMKLYERPLPGHTQSESENRVTTRSYNKPDPLRQWVSKRPHSYQFIPLLNSSF